MANLILRRTLSGSVDKLRPLFTGWSAKEKILTPVVVNLTTASIIFAVAVLFQKPIMRLFESTPAIREFPLHCVAEPYNYESATGNKEAVAVDLFIINLSRQPLTAMDLTAAARVFSPDKDNPLSPNIQLSMHPLTSYVITRVEPDDDFNETSKKDLKKGQVECKQNGKRWEVIVNEIKPMAMLKLTIYTDERSPIGSRGNLSSIPVTIDYPGRK